MIEFQFTHPSGFFLPQIIELSSIPICILCSTRPQPYLINHLSSPTIQNQTPFFHTYRCVCFVHLPPSEHTKETTQSTKCAFLGYTAYQKGFLVTSTNQMNSGFQNVVFFKKQYFFFKTRLSLR
eukprot:TRINITY_DN10139_c3_g1_i1.p1 TRINITY_DN10139_c3_g1~~TRINITY_DN10139_c3_g1_i1.p1  ORF type:complete len:124 (-),score=7.94 TRINITY_DN10139_c3_g1_i1:416-787(-)